MTDAQTEARAIAQDIVDEFHPMDDVPAHMIAGVAERIIATVLAAKDAELADAEAVRESREYWRRRAEEWSKRAERAEAELALEIAKREFWREAAARDQAQLAEVRKALDRALDPFAHGINGIESAEDHVQFLHSAISVARRALEAQGGENAE